ncbi:hypothetical protein [Saccharicrinis aurantiacus]|uniref:hypothetical protein n=1 Tax=Saccharicrinis aurantiacus TaxID=1849719 RepID=UPI002491C417|nr:hypothetical protein [Saccharicrinis aurantiacus]
MNLKLLNKIAKTIFITGGVIMIILGIKNTIRIERELAEETRFTIGYVIKWYQGAKGKPTVNYSYTIERKNYESSEYIKSGYKKSVGKRYFLKYYPLNPQNSKLLLDDPVPDWLKAPPNGWAEMPKLDMENKRILE